MSGGSWEYVYFKFEEVADRLRSCKCPHRRAFAAKVATVASVMHVIEWVDSGDTSPPADVLAITAALGDECQNLVLDEIRKEIRELVTQAETIIGQPIKG